MERMMNFQEAISRLLLPASSRPDLNEQPAIIRTGRDGQPDRVTTFGQLETLVDKATAAFKQSGVAIKDPVLLCSPNCAEVVAATLALWRLGAVAMPVDFRVTPGELQNIAGK